MRKLIQLCLFGTLAYYAAPALAAPCPPLFTVATWLTLAGGCTIGADTFVANSFNPFPSGPNSTPTAAQVNVTPLIDANGTGFMLTFLTPFSANPTGKADIDLNYSVSGPSLTNAFQSITGTATNQSFDQLVDNFCQGLNNPSCTSSTPFPNTLVSSTATICGTAGTTPPQGGCDVLSGGASVTAAKTVGFNTPSTTLVGVLKDMGAFSNPANGQGGFATITSVKNQFGPVPEPTSIVLLGSVLIGITMRIRKGRKQA